jgi:glycosyltransferase involved in cell wall biosynthesis
MLTTIDPDRTGLAFPAADAALLAWQIAKFFDDENLSSRLGAQARIVARRRHDPARVEQQLMSAYMEIAAQSCLVGGTATGVGTQRYT